MHDGLLHVVRLVETTPEYDRSNSRIANMLL